MFVHDVIIVQEVLPHIEVAGFHLFLSIFNAPGNQVVFNGFSFFHAHPFHDGGDLVGTEDPQEIIFQGEVEAGGAGISLTARATSQLVVHPPAFVSFGPQDVEPVQFTNPFAQHNIRAPSGHVGGNGHGFCLTGVGNDFSLFFVVFGIEHGVGNAGPFEHFAQHFRFFDGDGAHENRLAPVVKFLDFVNSGFEFFPFGLVDDIREIGSRHFLVCGDDHYVQFIDVIEFSRFRVRCTGHAGQLFIHAEVILKGHRGQGLVFSRHFYPLLGFYRLMQAIAPPTPRHHSAREFIHDHNLVVFDDIVDILFKEPEAFDELLRGMDQFGSPHVSCFNFPEPLVFFCIAEAFHLADIMAFIVHVGNHEIIRPLTRQKIDPLFSEFHSVALFIDGAVQILVQLRQNLLGAQHAFCSVDLFFQRLVLGHHVQINRVFGITPLDFEQCFDGVVIQLIAIQKLAHVF